MRYLVNVANNDLPAAGKLHQLFLDGGIVPNDYVVGDSQRIDNWFRENFKRLNCEEYKNSLLLIENTSCVNKGLPPTIIASAYQVIELTDGSEFQVLKDRLASRTNVTYQKMLEVFDV